MYCRLEGKACSTATQHWSLIRIKIIYFYLKEGGDFFIVIFCRAAQEEGKGRKQYVHQ